jgi:hypothetical protein
MATSIIFSKAKTVAAAIGSTLTAVLVALAVVQTVVDDGKLDVGEYSTLFGAAVTLVGTVYAVWRTENKVLRGTTSAGSSIRTNGM